MRHSGTQTNCSITCSVVWWILSWRMPSFCSSNPHTTSTERRQAERNYGINWRSDRHSPNIWAHFMSLARGKLRLWSANRRAGYFSNLTRDWLSIARVYSEQDTENGPWSLGSVQAGSCWHSWIQVVGGHDHMDDAGNARRTGYVMHRRWGAKPGVTACASTAFWHITWDKNLNGWKGLDMCMI